MVFLHLEVYGSVKSKMIIAFPSKPSLRIPKRSMTLLLPVLQQQAESQITFLCCFLGTG